MSKKFYLTTAIAYTSSKPHIGNVYEAILADCIVRYKKKDGYDTYFQTGTDEHGQKIEQTAKKLGVKLYKCDPYCSFQRGTNERTNALVRRWIPKGSSMKLVPQIYLDDICFEINTMPRKIFDFKTPCEIELDY